MHLLGMFGTRSGNVDASHLAARFVTPKGVASRTSISRHVVGPYIFGDTCLTRVFLVLPFLHLNTKNDTFIADCASVVSCIAFGY